MNTRLFVKRGMERGIEWGVEGGLFTDCREHEDCFSLSRFDFFGPTE